MNVPHRLACALLATALPLAARAADDAPAPARPATASASASASTTCAAPGLDRAANHVCALALARRAETERSAGHDDAALAALAQADVFSPEDLRFAIARAELALKKRGQLSPAGVEAAAKAAPDDVGLALMHAELAATQKKFDLAVADADRVIARRPSALLAYEIRATANVARSDFGAARADVDRILAADPKSPGTLRLRGILRNNDGDHAGALADYQLAHALAPKPDDPFVIGSTQFLLRQYEDSAATLARHAPPAPQGTYWLLWRYLALARVDGVEPARGSLGPATLPGVGVPWPVPVIDFYLGAIDGSTLLSTAKAAQARDDLAQVCEAHFYLAEDALLRRRADAIALFQAALHECPRNFHEYEGAAAELRAAGMGAAVPAVAPAASAASAAG